MEEMRHVPYPTHWLGLAPCEPVTVAICQVSTDMTTVVICHALHRISLVKIA